MVDHLTPKERRALMQRVRRKDTAPEMVVRRLVFSMGYRYRLHRKGLPGSPDIVFGPAKKVIFVHGCFWHAHGCRRDSPPKSRLDYWQTKRERNRARDAANVADLERLGWQVLTVWECETRDADALTLRLQHFLKRDGQR